MRDEFDKLAKANSVAEKPRKSAPTKAPPVPLQPKPKSVPQKTDAAPSEPIKAQHMLEQVLKPALKGKWDTAMLAPKRKRHRDLEALDKLLLASKRPKQVGFSSSFSHNH
jgi:hypothetical protein